MTRRVSVIVDADIAPFSRSLAVASAEARAFANQLHGLDDRINVRVDVDRGSLSAAATGIERIGITANTSSRQLDSMSGRVRLIAEALATLGPATIPIGAVAIPAITGLATELGVAALAAGTTILAFQGVGTALTTLNRAELNPTVANLAAAQHAMDRLGPAAQTFVVELRKMGDVAKGLRDAAAGGLFPDLLDGLHELEKLAPRAERILGGIGAEVGSIADKAANSLTSERWEPFFGFLETEARPTLIKLSDTLGNVLHGLTETVIAFTPLNHATIDTLLQASAAFDQWAHSLAGTQGFADFVAYVHDTGPQVADTVLSIADAMLDIVEAAAPIGGPVLQVLESVAKIVSLIADSDLGTPIFGLIAAMLTLNRVVAITNTAMGRPGVGGGLFSGLNAVRTQAAVTSTGIRTLATDLRILATTTQATLGPRAAAGFIGPLNQSQTALRGASESAARLRATLGTLGKTAAIVGTVAVATSGVAESMGFANASTLALTGFMVGGAPGAVVGGLVGASIDVAHAQDAAADAIKRANAAMESGAGPRALTDQLKSLDEQIQSTKDALNPSDDKFGILGRVSPLLSLKSSVTGINEFLTDTNKHLLETRDNTAEVTQAYSDLAVALGAHAFRVSPTGSPVEDNLATKLGLDGITEFVPKLDEVQRAAERAAPAMAALGITAQDLVDMSPDQIEQTARAIENWNRNADSAEGKTKAFNLAVAGLDDGMQSTEESASALTDALDALFGPGLNLSAARDRFHETLDSMMDDLDHFTNKAGNEVAGSRSLFGQTEGARTNRDVIRTAIGEITDLLKAQADAGASADDLGKSLQRQRDALIAAGVAAGLNKDELVKLLDKLGLGPDLIKSVREELAKLDNTDTKPKIDINAKGAHAEIDWISGRLKALDGKNVTSTVHVRTVKEGSGFGPQVGFASGGWTGPGSKYTPKGVVHAEEFVVRKGPAAAFRPWLEGLNRLPGYANGGYVSPNVGASVAAMVPHIDYDRLAAAMAQVRPMYGDVHVLGDGSFRRQLMQDKQTAALGGVG